MHRWVDAEAERAPDTIDRTLIRLGLAVTRGLLLDLVGTGEEELVDAAYARFVAMVTAS